MKTFLSEAAAAPSKKLTFTEKLNKDVAELITEAAKKAAREKLEKKDDPAAAVLKAYIAMDKEMLKVVDEHIERVRRSSEKNKELFRKLSLKKEAEKRSRQRKEFFDESAEKTEKAEEQRKLLRMKSKS